MSKRRKSNIKSKWEKFTRKVKNEHNKEMKETLNQIKIFRDILIKEIKKTNNLDNKQKSLNNKINNKESTIDKIAHKIAKLEYSLKKLRSKTCKKLKPPRRIRSRRKKSGGCGKKTMKNILKKLKRSLNFKLTDFKLSPKKIIRRYKKVRKRTRRRYKKRRK